MSNWIFDLLSGGLSKKAAKKKAELPDQDKLVDNDFVKDVMSIDEEVIAKDEDDAQHAEEEARDVQPDEGYDEVGAIMAYESGELDDQGILELFSHLVSSGRAWHLQGHYGRTASALIEAGYLDEKGNILKEIGAEAAIRDNLNKKAAYEQGDTSPETVEKDHKLRISGLSDYNLAEFLAEYALQEKQTTTVNLNEEKEKQLKSVKSNRQAAEEKAWSYLKDRTHDDWKKTWEKFRSWENKPAKEEDLYKDAPSKKNWRSNDKDFKVPSDEDKIDEDMEGVGKEEEKGQVGKEASESTDKIRKKVVKKINDIVEEELDDKVIMEKDDAVEEHERLTKTLESPSHEDDKEEAKEQKEELRDYKEASLKCPECGSENITPSEGHKLNKCDSCHTAFDDESSKKEATSDEAQKWISNKIKKLVEEGKDQDQAAAIAYSMAREKGYKVPEKKAEEETINLETPVPEAIDKELPAVEQKDSLEEPKKTVDDKVTEKIDQKVEEKAEEITDKVEQKVEEHEEEIEEKVEDKINEKVEEAFEEHHQEHHDLPLDTEPTHEDAKHDESEEKHEEPEEKKEEEDKDKPEEEIEPQASKKEVLKKIAEVESPWRVIKNDKGEEIIARVAPQRNTKLSRDKDKLNDKKSKELQ